MQKDINFQYYEAASLQKYEFLVNLYFKNHLKPINCSLCNKLKLIDIDALRKTFKILIERHKVLRTTLVMRENKIMQKVWPYEPDMFNLEIHDISKSDNPSIIVNELSNNQEKKIFYPDQFPNLLITIIKLNKKEYYIIMTIPHRISDAETMWYLKKEINFIYKECLNKKSITLPIAYPFGDYLNETIQELESRNALKHKVFWNKLLRDIPTNNITTKCSAFKERKITSYKEQIFNELQSFGIDTVLDIQKHFLGNIISLSDEPSSSFCFIIDKRRLKILKIMSVKTTIKLPLIIMATYFLLIFILTGEKDIIIGILTNLRDKEKLKNVIGCMVDTILIRHKINEDQTVFEFLKDICISALQSFRHKIYPISMALHENDVSFPSVSSIILNIISHETESSMDAHSPEIKHSDTKYTDKFDMFFDINIYTNCINYTGRYKSELFTKSTIERIYVEYLNLIDKLGDFSTMKINDLK